MQITNKPGSALLLLLLAALCLLSSCPTGNSGQQTGQGQASGTQAIDPLAVTLVRSDLGLGDGNYVREVDELLESLNLEGLVDYSAVGELPQELTVEGMGGDIGLPHAGSDRPGTMTIEEATLLLDSVESNYLLVLTSPLLVDAALERIEAGQIQTEALVVLDNNGFAVPEGPTPVPVYVVEYNVKDAAFLAGVSVAESAAVSMFIALAVETDPQAEEFLDAAAAGARFSATGSQVVTVTLAVDDELGYVTPEIFRRALLDVYEEKGSYFQPNHYIVNVGRATPTIMLALSSAPENAYVVGAYSDYRRVRPARVVGCALKKPAEALDYILRALQSGETLEGLATEGVIHVGLEQDATGFTDFELYGRYNPDSDDIEDAVTNTEALIRVGELDYDY